MRIAFVGKGGGGKTTIATLFSLYLNKIKENKDIESILLIDADINVHTPSLLTKNKIDKNKYISTHNAIMDIKTYLKANNNLIKSMDSFRKTTPPSKDSNLIKMDFNNSYILNKYTEMIDNNFGLMIVGTYEKDGIASSCYHNNLSIFENILSHTIDNKGVIVADMVAGVDAFASSLHTQFDILLLIIEPTRRGIEVYNQYIELAKEAQIENLVFIVGNKIKNDIDIEFLKNNISQNKLIGFFKQSNYLDENDKVGEVLNIEKLEKENINTLEKIFLKLKQNQIDPNQRLEKLKQVHKIYVSQSFIKDKFGDLNYQIDNSFKF